MPSRKFNLKNTYDFNNGTREEQEFYVEIKKSIRSRWQLGQKIHWFDFQDWLYGFLEQSANACFAFDVLLLLSQENIIKGDGHDAYELV